MENSKVEFRCLVTHVLQSYVYHCRINFISIFYRTRAYEIMFSKLNFISLYS